MPSGPAIELSVQRGRPAGSLRRAGRNALDGLIFLASLGTGSNLIGTPWFVVAVDSETSEEVFRVRAGREELKARILLDEIAYDRRVLDRDAFLSKWALSR